MSDINSDPNPYESPEDQTPNLKEEFDQSQIEQDKDARLWGMLTHLASLSGYAVPLGNFAGPLVVWLVKKDEYPFVDDQGKESLNFQISVLIYFVVAGVLACALVGFVLLAVVALFQIVMVIVACVKANNGEAYRYPLTIRLIQ